MADMVRLVGADLYMVKHAASEVLTKASTTESHQRVRDHLLVDDERARD
jgi:hypothetical protein